MQKVNIEQEFTHLQQEQSSTRDYSCGTEPANLRKNRYSNVIAQELTRVKLKSEGSDSSCTQDYINANHFRSGSAHFILTQAPLPSTFSDFWKMIWQQNSKVVVMLTRFSEGIKTKADSYWPSAGNSLTFGNVTVQHLSHYFSQEYQLHTRLFQLECGSQTRTITHLQLDSWPDFGVPSGYKHILHLSHMVSLIQSQSGERNPIVVHCSAGLGRTGTFATLHVALTQGGSVRDIVRTVREARPGSVQTLAQYQYIYDALAERVSPNSKRFSGVAPVATQSPKRIRV